MDDSDESCPSPLLFHTLTSTSPFPCLQNGGNACAVRLWPGFDDESESSACDTLVLTVRHLLMVPVQLLVCGFIQPHMLVFFVL